VRNVIGTVREHPGFMIKLEVAWRVAALPRKKSVTTQSHPGPFDQKTLIPPESQATHPHHQTHPTG